MSEVIVDAIAEKTALQQLIDTFTPLVGECKLHFDDDGVHIRAVDAANVAMAYVDLETGAFEAYDSPGAVTQGINLESVDERLSVGNSGDLVNLSLDMETRRLSVDVGNISQAVAMIDPDSVRQEPDLPDLDLPNTISLTGSQIDGAIDAVGMVSDHVEIVGDAGTGTVEFLGEGDTDKTVVDFGEGDTGAATAITEDTASLFSHEYLSNFVDPIPSDAEVTIHFGEEFPMVWKWTAVEGHMEVEQMVAPRVRSD